MEDRRKPTDSTPPSEVAKEVTQSWRSAGRVIATPEAPQQLLDPLATALASLVGIDPLERETFGHGSYGQRCRFCKASDYTGSLDHDVTCIWAVTNHSAERTERLGLPPVWARWTITPATVDVRQEP